MSHLPRLCLSKLNRLADSIPHGRADPAKILKGRCPSRSMVRWLTTSTTKERCCNGEAVQDNRSRVESLASHSNSPQSPDSFGTIRRLRCSFAMKMTRESVMPHSIYRCNDKVCSPTLLFRITASVETIFSIIEYFSLSPHHHHHNASHLESIQESTFSADFLSISGFPLGPFSHLMDSKGTPTAGWTQPFEFSSHISIHVERSYRTIFNSGADHLGPKTE